MKVGMELDKLILGGVAVLILALEASASELPVLEKGMTYREIKTAHESFLRTEPTKAERVDAMRRIVKVSRLGDRGLNQVFGNFEGSHSIDPRIPGVEDSVVRQASSNASMAKGYRRELLYATAFHHDPRFTLEAMNEPRRGAWGTTDADIVIRYHASGLSGRVEVKDYSLGSQSTNRRKLEIQIDKMAYEGRETGELQFWFNRREVNPGLRDYAARKGVMVLGMVSTGRSPVGKTMPIQDAKQMVENQFQRETSARALAAGTELGFGVAMLWSEVPPTWANLQSVSNSETRSSQSLLRLGQHGSLALSGGGMVLAGGTGLAERYAGRGLQGTLRSWGGVGRVVSIVGFGVGEGFLIARYRNGDVTSREFRTEQWVLATTGAGSLGGSWVGGLIGTAVVKSPFWASQAGGLAGGLLGNEFGKLTAGEYYELQYAKLDRAFGKAVCAHYGVRGP